MSFSFDYSLNSTFQALLERAKPLSDLLAKSTSSEPPFLVLDYKVVVKLEPLGEGKKPCIRAYLSSVALREECDHFEEFEAPFLENAHRSAASLLFDQLALFLQRQYIPSASLLLFSPQDPPSTRFNELNDLLDQRGRSPFQCKLAGALEQLTSVGKTVSYKQLSCTLKSAPRAVGRALGANLFPLFVPCHRVIPLSGGKLSRVGKLSQEGRRHGGYRYGGYRFGGKLKEQLLAWEESIALNRW